MLTAHLAKKKGVGKVLDLNIDEFSFGDTQQSKLRIMINITMDQKEAGISRKVFLWDYNCRKKRKKTFPF